MEISCIGFAVEYQRRFGQAAVERGFITRAQLKAALAEQVDDELAGRPHRLLGDILLEKKWMTPAEIDVILCETLGLPAKARRMVM